MKFCYEMALSNHVTHAYRPISTTTFPNPYPMALKGFPSKIPACRSRNPLEYKSSSVAPHITARVGLTKLVGTFYELGIG